MKSALLTLALISSSVLAATPTPPIRVERGGTQTEYQFNVPPEGAAPLVVVVPDTTVPLQQIIVQTRPRAEDKPPKITSNIEGAILPGGVKSAKEAMETWPFAALLEKADTALIAPETIKLEQSSDVRLVIDMSKVAEKIEAEIKGKNKKGEVINVSRVIVAKILAPDFTVIEAVADGRQVLNLTGPTEWRWSVTPKKIGEFKVNVTVSAVIEIGNDRAERLIKVFDQEVTVFVTAADAAKYFFTKNWQWLWSTLVLPFGIWLWRERRKKKALVQLTEDE